MNDKIIYYLIDEKKATREVAARVANKVCEYEDIKNEFLKWLEERRYDFENPVTVDGYTAYDIYKKAPFMDGIGVYNFLVTLRNDPLLGREIIASHFAVK